MNGSRIVKFSYVEIFNQNILYGTFQNFNYTAICHVNTSDLSILLIASAC